MPRCQHPQDLGVGSVRRCMKDVAVHGTHAPTMPLLEAFFSMSHASCVH